MAQPAEDCHYYSLQPHNPDFPNAGIRVGTEWVTSILFKTTVPKRRRGEEGQQDTP